MAVAARRAEIVVVVSCAEESLMNLKTGLMVASLLISVVIGVVLARSPSAIGARGAGAGPGATKVDHPLIGLSLDTLKEARWQADRDLFVDQAKKAGARDVLVQSANSDDSRQIADVTSLISSGVNVLVIVPHDGAAMAQAVKLAHDANIPVIAYDRLIRDSDLDLYMSFDNVRVGRKQAQYLVEHLKNPGHGRIVRIYGSKTDNNAALFKQGQDEVLKPYIDRGDIVVVQEDWAEDWKPENAKRIVNAAISKGGKNIDAVLASNDGTAGGAIQALSEEGLAGKVLVTGQDAELVACQRIVQGTQAMTIYKPLKKLATLAAQKAVAVGQGKSVVANSTVNNGKTDVPSILEDVIAVDKDNLMDTVVKDGFHKKEEIYGGAK
jgi:D-xylose transport system substrate-binding protein